MQRSQPQDQVIRVLVDEKTSRELALLAAARRFKLSEAGRRFFRALLAGDPHALALLPPTKR